MMYLVVNYELRITKQVTSRNLFRNPTTPMLLGPTKNSVSESTRPHYGLPSAHNLDTPPSLAALTVGRIQSEISFGLIGPLNAASLPSSPAYLLPLPRPTAALPKIYFICPRPSGSADRQGLGNLKERPIFVLDMHKLVYINLYT